MEKEVESEEEELESLATKLAACVSNYQTPLK